MPKQPCGIVKMKAKAKTHNINLPHEITTKQYGVYKMCGQ